MALRRQLFAKKLPSLLRAKMSHFEEAGVSGRVHSFAWLRAPGRREGEAVNPRLFPVFRYLKAVGSFAMQETAKGREPFLKQLSEEVALLFGFKDARAELKVKALKAVPITIKVDAARIKVVKEAFDAAYGHAMARDADRKVGKGAEAETIVDRQLDERARAKWGFADCRIELSVRMTKFLPWIPMTITKEELLTGKPAMDEVWAWAQLPEDVRETQGVD